MPRCKFQIHKAKLLLLLDATKQLPDHPPAHMTYDGQRIIWAHLPYLGRYMRVFWNCESSLHVAKYLFVPRLSGFDLSDPDFSCESLLDIVKYLFVSSLTTIHLSDSHPSCEYSTLSRPIFFLVSRLIHFGLAASDVPPSYWEPSPSAQKLVAQREELRNINSFPTQLIIAYCADFFKYGLWTSGEVLEYNF